MYVSDGRDTIAALPAMPQSSVGAPLPVVLADEDQLMVAYLGEPLLDQSSTGVVHVVNPATQGQTIVLVEFVRYAAYYHGAPNDESLAGHPLAARGLEPYGAFEMRNSAWVRTLERMNRVHSGHSPERYARLRHFILSFHDSTFECLADAFASSTHSGSLSEVLPEMMRQLGYGAREQPG